MRKAVAILALVSSAFLPAAACQVQDAQRAYHRRLDHLLGKATEDDIVAIYGAPISSDKVGSLEVWHYRWNLGSGAYAQNMGNGFYAARSWDRYDDLQIMFNRNGVMQRWYADIER